MKKLNKLQINSKKLMNNEELMTLKGGGGMGKCVLTNNQTCYEGYFASCNDMGAICTANCPGWDYGICTGW